MINDQKSPNFPNIVGIEKYFRVQPVYRKTSDNLDSFSLRKLSREQSRKNVKEEAADGWCVKN